MSKDTDKKRKDGIVDFLLLEETEKNIILNAVASLVILSGVLLYGMFFSSLSNYTPFLLLCLVLSIVLIKYTMNDLEEKKSTISSENILALNKVNELTKGIKIYRTVLLLLISLKILSSFYHFS